MEDIKTPPSPPAGEVMEPVESVDPKMTVMGGSESQKASDYANCKYFATPATSTPRRVRQQEEQPSLAAAGSVEFRLVGVLCGSASPKCVENRSRYVCSRVFFVWCFRPPPLTAMAAECMHSRRSSVTTWSCQILAPRVPRNEQPSPSMHRPRVGWLVVDP